MKFIGIDKRASQHRAQWSNDIVLSYEQINHLFVEIASKVVIEREIQRN